MSDNEELEDQLGEQPAEDGGDEAAGEDGGEGAARLVEGEADDEDKNEFQDSSEEDEDEEQNEYEEDGFIVDDAEEVEEEEEERREAPRKRRKKKRERELRLDDDDYDLLEENQVQGIRRPTGRKRLKSKAMDSRKANDAADIQKELFGYEELEDEVEDAGDRDERRDTYEQDGDEDFDDLDEQDEMADFIVEGDGTRRRHRRRAADIPGVSSRAMQDAFDIFGDVDALMDMYEAARLKPAATGGDAAEAGGAEEEEEDDYLEDDDEAAAEARRQRREQRQRDKTYKQAMKVMDPEQLARAHLRPEDQQIKDRDVPERLQELLGLEGGGGAGGVAGVGMDLESAAEWIYSSMREANMPEWQLLARGVEEVDGTYDSATASGRLDDPHAGEHRGEVEGEDVLGGPHEALLRLTFHRAVLVPRSEDGMKRWSDDDGRHGRVKQAIRQVLTQFFERHEEVPLVAMYRKELAGPLLAMASDDTPVVTTEDELTRQRDMRHKKHYDQGFVQPHHRRIRRWSVLWAVFDAALKFRSLTQRRERASAALARSRDLLTEALATADPASDRAAQLEYDLRALDECGDALLIASTPDGLSDVQQRMNQVLASYPEVQLAALSISTGTGVAGGGAGTTTRRPNRGAVNRAARLLGIQELVGDFCLPPAAFVNNLLEAGHGGGLANEPPTPAGSVADWVEAALAGIQARHPEFAGLASYNTDHLLSQVRAAAVSNLVHDAGLRNFLRNEFFKQAVVSSEATEAGEAVLDPFHKYSLATRLRKKPLTSFGSSDLMLRLDGAHRERLAVLRLHLEGNTAEKLVADVAELFQSSDRGAVAQQWNTLRRDIVKMALEEQLLPAFRTHFHTKLLAEAKEAALRAYSDALWQVATAGPLRLPLADAEDEFLTHPRLCIVVYGNQELNPATGQPNNTAVVFLNELGNLTDFFFAGQLSGNIRRSGQGAGAVFTDPAKSKDVVRIRDKLLEHLPHAVLVGMSAPQCRQLCEDVRNIADSLLEHSADALQDHETRGIYCYPMDEKLAALWENSSSARGDLREHAPLVRRAVGLGRGALDPLALLAALCGPDREVLSLNVYDMQDSLEKDERMAAVTRVMVTATAQVGVDVNLACNVSWRADLLQFVPGLGPRKAGALLAALTRNRNKAESRSMLYKDLGVLGKVVFRNAGPYLRVLKVPGIRHLENLSFRTLDATRISPESYRLAIQLAQAAGGGGDAEEALEKREKIEAYDLEAFMADSGLTGPSPGLATLIDIVAELVCPALELRPAWGELQPRQVYLLCSNESDDSLRPGRIVDVKITYVTRDALKVILINSGTEGMVRAEDVHSAAAPGGRVGGPEWQSSMQSRLGSVARARILGLEEQPDASGEGKRFMVVLSTKSSVVNDEDGFYEKQYCVEREPYYHVRERNPATTRRRVDEQRPREQQLLVRPIRHPMFKNITQLDANALLGRPDMPVGSCIIRPSARSNPNVLDVSIKTVHGPSSNTPIIMAAQLQESDKPQGRAAHLTLAPPFSIDLSYCGLGVVKYEDLDQVVADFVEPLTQHCMAVTSHRKYVDAAQAAVEDRVRSEKQANPKTYPYYLTAHKNNMFYIIFCLSQSVHKEPFYASPKGFYFRSHTYADIEHVLAIFKKQPTDPAKRASAHQRTELGYSAPSRDLPQMRTGLQGPTQGGSQYGGGAVYSQQQPSAYYGAGGGGGSQYPQTQAYNGGGGNGNGMYGGGSQWGGGGGGGSQWGGGTGGSQWGGDGAGSQWDRGSGGGSQWGGASQFPPPPSQGGPGPYSQPGGPAYRSWG